MKRDKQKIVKAATAESRRARLSFDRRHALVAAVLLFVFICYSNSFRAPFLLDNAEILNDTRFRSATSANVGRILNGPYHQSMLTNLYRPVTNLSYLYNYAVLGDGVNSAGYHAFNFFVHAANILLAYTLGLILFEAIPPALVLAALWGAHPILTEAVTNIVGRADMLAAFGVLAGVVAYHHSLRRDGLARIGLVAAMAGATTIGMFSKEIGIVVVALVILYDQSFARDLPWSRRIPGLLAALIPGAMFLIVRARVLASVPIGPFPFTDNPIMGAGFVEGRMTAFKVLARYVGLFLWPAKLSPDYSYNEIPVRTDPIGVVGLLLCLGAAALAIWAWRKHRALTFAIAIFFFAIAPVSNIFLVIGSVMGERFAYLPSLGCTAAVVYGLHRLWIDAPHRRTAIAATVGIVALVFAVRTHARNDDWNDDQRMWESAVDASPGSFKTHINLAAAIPRNAAGWNRIVDEAGRALAIIDSVPDDRNTAVPFRNAGVLYRAYGEHLASVNDTAGAAQWYGRSLEVLRRSERIELKLDEICRDLNRRRGLSQPTYLPGAPYRELGITYLRLNDIPNALQALETGHAIESEPDLLENLAVAYGLAGNLRQSARMIVEELAVDSSRSYLANKLVSIYRQIDPAGCAVQKDSSGESLNLACPMVRDDLCGASRNVARTYAKRNQTVEAASIRRVAVQELGCPAASVD